MPYSIFRETDSLKFFRECSSPTSNFAYGKLWISSIQPSKLSNNCLYWRAILQSWLVTMHQQQFSISICQDCMKQRTLIASSYRTDKLMLSWSSVSLFNLVSLLHKILDYSSALIATAISPWYQPKQLIVFFSPRLHWHVQEYGWWNE